MSTVMSRAVVAIVALMSAMVIRALGVVAVGFGAVDEAFGLADTSGSCSSSVLRSSFVPDPRVPRFDLTRSDMLSLS